MTTLSNKAQEAHALKARLRWQCRRGMKELEVMLGPFLETAFDQLSKTQQKDFEILLQATDADLYTWFLGHETPQDPNMQKMLALIQNTSKNVKAD